jgi:hypothetical protein
MPWPAWLFIGLLGGFLLGVIPGVMIGKVSKGSDDDE